MSIRSTLSRCSTGVENSDSSERRARVFFCTSTMKSTAGKRTRINSSWILINNINTLIRYSWRSLYLFMFRFDCSSFLYSIYIKSYTVYVGNAPRYADVRGFLSDKFTPSVSIIEITIINSYLIAIFHCARCINQQPSRNSNVRISIIETKLHRLDNT